MLTFTEHSKLDSKKKVHNQVSTYAINGIVSINK